MSAIWGHAGGASLALEAAAAVIQIVEAPRASKETLNPKSSEIIRNLVLAIVVPGSCSASGIDLKRLGSAGSCCPDTHANISGDGLDWLLDVFMSCACEMHVVWWFEFRTFWNIEKCKRSALGCCRMFSRRIWDVTLLLLWGAEILSAAVGQSCRAAPLRGFEAMEWRRIHGMYIDRFGIDMMIHIHIIDNNMTWVICMYIGIYVCPYCIYTYYCLSCMLYNILYIWYSKLCALNIYGSKSFLGVSDMVLFSVFLCHESCNCCTICV